MQARMRNPLMVLPDTLKARSPSTKRHLTTVCLTLRESSFTFERVRSTGAVSA